MPGQLLEFYGLREHPFGVSPNPRYLYLSTQHREALATLVSGIENLVGFSALIAEPGVGKTVLLFEVLRQFKDRASIALISNTQCSGSELLRHIVLGLHIPGGETELDPVRLYHMITAFASERQNTKPVVIIIDEAQDLENSALETLRLLSNYEAADRKLLHIILAGQPQLRDKLRSNSQLFQRIAIVSRLGRLSPQETEECIAFRLQAAGYTGSRLFSNEAMFRIKRASGGVPREINRICLNALEAGFALRKKEIGAKIIEQVVSDLDLSSGCFQEPSSEAEFFETGAQVAHIDRKSFGAPPESRRADKPAEAWIADPIVDVGLGDEVIESVLSELRSNSIPRAGISTTEAAHHEATPLTAQEGFDLSDKPRISFAHAGVGPTDDEIRALLSGMDLTVSTPTKPSKQPRVRGPEVTEVESKDSSATAEPGRSTSADPRVLKIFAPRKPSEVPVRKIDPRTFEITPEPIAHPVREDPWNTGVPIDPWARFGSPNSTSSETQKRQEAQTPSKKVENPGDSKPRKKMHPFVVFLCLVVLAIVILYWTYPHLPPHWLQ